MFSLSSLIFSLSDFLIFDEFFKLSFLIIIFLKLSLEYNFLTTASALKRGPLPADKILLAVVFPEAKEPVM